MNNVTLILNNQLEVPLSAENRQRIELDFSFRDFSPNQNLVDDLLLTFYCTNDQYDVINFVDNHVNQNGIYTGIPWRFVSSIDKENVIADGLVNLIHPETRFDRKLGRYELKFIPNNNSVFEVIRKINLRSLEWNNSEYRIVESVLNSVPDLGQTALLSIVIFLAFKELKEAGYNLGKAIADGAGGITGPIVTGLKIAAAVAYYAFIIASIYNLLKQVSDALFSKIKTYYCINVKETFEKACSSFGYTFESSLFNGVMSELTYLYTTNEPPALKGLPTNDPVPDINLLEFFELWGEYFYAKPKINTQTKTIQFENIFTYIGNAGNVILQDLYKDNSFTTNYSELYNNISIRFLQDTLETNTFLRIDALGINLTGQQLNSIGNKINVDYKIQGVEEINDLFNNQKEVVNRFARGFRKEKETTIEKLFNGIYDIVGGIASVFGNKGNGSQKLKGRIGKLLLSNDWVVVPKAFILDGRNISKNSFKTIHAETQFENYYKELGIDKNQWIIFEDKDPQPICSPELANELKFNNIQRDYDGRTILIEENIKDTFTNLYNFKYRRKQQEGDYGFLNSDKIEIDYNYSD